jgi:hypothetical protein
MAIALIATRDGEREISGTTFRTPGYLSAEGTSGEAKSWQSVG